MLGSGTHCSKIDRFLGTHAKGATESNKEKKRQKLYNIGKNQTRGIPKFMKNIIKLLETEVTISSGHKLLSTNSRSYLLALCQRIKNNI